MPKTNLSKPKQTRGQTSQATRAKSIGKTPKTPADELCESAFGVELNSTRRPLRCGIQ